MAVLVAGLIVWALVVLLWVLWLRWEPEVHQRGDPLPAPVEPQDPTTPFVPEPLFAKFLLRPPGFKLRALCDCNGTRVVWLDDPCRPDARLGVCRRCGKVRFDAVRGTILSL